MKPRRNSALACTFLLTLAGCHHASKGIQQTAVPTAPAIAPVMVSVPPPTHHDQPQVTVEPVPSPSMPVEPVRHAGRSPRKPAAGSATPAPSAIPQVAINSPTVELGNLSTGGETSTGYKQETAELLKAQQQRLSAISQANATTHPTEIAQVKAFLQKAIVSWEADDYEGAHTLVVKAKVLLDDLRR